MAECGDWRIIMYPGEMCEHYLDCKLVIEEYELCREIEEKLEN